MSLEHGSRLGESLVIFEEEQAEAITQDRLIDWWLVRLESKVSKVDTESRS